MKLLVFSLIVVMTSFASLAQSCNCPVGATSITGSANINEQNNADDYCVTGSWTGTIQNIANGSTITICPTATWTMPSNVTLSRDVVIDNYGTITDGGAGLKLFIQNQTTLNNKVGGSISLRDFENQEGTFNNEGDLTAVNIYIHGNTTNSGTMTSTADCGGTATQSCGFYVGSKSSPLNNTGSIDMVDGTIRDGVIGGGTMTSTGTLDIANNSQETDNVFIVNNLTFGASSNISQGDFTISGTLNCNNANFTAVGCFDGGSYGTSCAGGSTPITSCLTVPVTIKDFQVSRLGDDVIAAWEVGAEINVEYYQILTSQDGRVFEASEQFEAVGDAFYQVSLKDAPSVTTYYKIKSVDLDGTEAIYSGIVTLKGSTAVAVSVYPNPVTKDNTLTIDHGLDESTEMTVSLSEVSGRTLLVRHFDTSSPINIDLSEIGVTSGVYLLQVQSGNEIHTEKVLVR